MAKALHLSWFADEQCYTEDWNAESSISSPTARQEETSKSDTRHWPSLRLSDLSSVVRRKYLLSLFLLLNLFTKTFISSLWKKIGFDFSWLCLFQIYLNHQNFSVLNGCRRRDSSLWLVIQKVETLLESRANARRRAMEIENSSGIVETFGKEVNY